MPVIIIAVFSAVFAIVLLLSMSFDSSGVQSRKQTRDRLAAIAPAAALEQQDEGAGLLRDEVRGSSIGWIDERLKSINLFGQIRELLVQAEMKWTVGGLLIMSLASWVVVALAVFLRTNVLWLSALLGAIGAAGPDHRGRGAKR